MKPSTHKILLSSCLAALLLAGCAGEMARRDGVNLILEGHVDEGLAKLQEAVQKSPKDADIKAEYLRQRDQVIGRLLGQANSARVTGNFDAATGHFQHVLRLDSANVMAANGVREVDADRRLAAMLAEAQKRAAAGDNDGAKDILRVILMERPNDAQANLLRHRLEEQNIVEATTGPRLNVQGHRPVTLQFRDANLKMVIDAIAKATGINVLLDKDVKSDIKITIFVKDSPVEETLDLILLQSQLEKRVLGPNSVLIYNATSAKQKDYQELKVRRFVLTNADPKQVQTMLKTILRVKDLYVDEKTNAIIIRDTEAVIRVSEKLIASIDLPEPEVMLEVQLLDLDRKKTVQLGIDWPNAVSWIYPVGGADSGDTIKNIRAQARGSAIVSFTPNLGASLKALQTDGDTRVLATPRIRTRSKEKAKIMIGNRTPIISSAAVPSTVAGANAVYNTNIQYLDTGIKLEVEPVVYIDGEVSIKITMEVSDLGTEYKNTTTGTLAYATTTNNATTTLRLKDGETQILAGLIRASSGNSGSNKVPGLGDAPVIGRLFGVQSDNWQNRELVLAITPRIVRNMTPGDAETIEMWSGTESVVRFDNFHKGPTKASSKVVPATPVAPNAAPAAAGTLPGKATEAEPVPAAAEQERSVAPVDADLGGVALPKLTGPSQGKVGDIVEVAVAVPGSDSIGTMTFGLRYDKDKLQAIELISGNPMNAAGFQGQFDANSGTMLGVVKGDAGGVPGGNLAIARFKAIAPGKAVVNPLTFNAMGIDKRPMQIGKPWPYELTLSR